MNLHVPQEDSKEWDDQQISGEGDGVYKLDIRGGQLRMKKVLVDGVLEGTLGALRGDEIEVLGMELLCHLGLNPQTIVWVE
ncbi:hypothetical protein Tco_0924903 [Tanacetum coccineum]|uniref:Uncharacterized protein n=1 Tax=Tanacetum coccineum TaxID=301880 RepID=A0ABQ5DBI4_9ASTR